MSETLDTGTPPVTTVPAVTATEAGTISVELSPRDAGVLARILAHYDVLTSRGGIDTQLATLRVAVDDPSVPLPKADGYSPAPWHHTIIRLLTEKARAEALPDAVLVPFHRSGDYLLEVGPGEEAGR